MGPGEGKKSEIVGGPAEGSSGEGNEKKKNEKYINVVQKSKTLPLLKKCEKIKK